MLVLTRKINETIIIGENIRVTILAIHGYPDNHHVWDPVATILARRFNVVAYDVRGAGQSSRPAGRSGYRLPQLVADVGAVIERLGVDTVHLLAHDWGSIQAWAAVTDDTVMRKIASFTSVSGPHLNYAGKFLRSARTPRAEREREGVSRCGCSSASTAAACGGCLSGCTFPPPREGGSE